MDAETRKDVAELRANIAAAPAAVQQAIESIAEEIRAFVKQHGDLGAVALVLVTAEYAEADSDDD